MFIYKLPYQKTNQFLIAIKLGSGNPPRIILIISFSSSLLLLFFFYFFVFRNFLAAALLAIFENEEDAFWGLCFLVERIYASDFFAKRPRLHGFQIDSEVFFDLTLVHLPLLCEFISHTDLHNLVKLLSFRWFIPLWIDEFPTNICLLVWDCLMLDYLTVLNPASPRSYNETLPFRQSPSPTRQLREGFLINLRFGLAVLKLAEDSIRLLVEEQDPLIVPSQAYAICLNTARTCSWEDLSRTASEFDLNGVSMSVLRESVLQKVWKLGCVCVKRVLI